MDSELLRRAAEGNKKKKTKQNKLRRGVIMLLSMVFKRVWDIYLFDQRDKFNLYILNEPLPPLHCACDRTLLNTQPKIAFQKVKNDSHCGIMFYAGAESVTITEEEGASKERKKGNYLLLF